MAFLTAIKVFGRAARKDVQALISGLERRDPAKMCAHATRTGSLTG